MKKKFIVLLVLIFGLVLASCDEPADDTIKLEDIQITITEFASGDSVNSVTEDFVLPIGFDNNVTATWESSNTNVIKISGKNAEVTRPEDSNKEVKLTPTLKYTNKDGDLIQLKREAITVTVIKAEEEVIDLSAIELVIVFATGDDINNVTEDFVLPVTFEGGVTATWVSDDTDVIVIEGKDATVTRSIESDKEVNLTATLKLDDETLERTPIKVTVLKLDLSPVVEGTLYHWMPNSVGANLVANIEIYDADPLDVEVKLNDYDLVEGLDFEVINDELIIYGDFLVEKSNQLGDYELEVSTLYGSTIFEFFVVDNPENTSIETKEIEVADMGSLTQAVLTEPIAGAPEVMITEIGSDAGKFSYVEVFNNTNKKRNLKGHMLVFANTAAEINLGTVVNNNGLFGVPMGAIPFLIDEDFELEPFETGIIWYVLGGNDTPYIVGVGGSYDEVGLAANANTWLFDWQGGTLRESDFRKHHGIPETTKVIAVRGLQITVNNTTAHDDNGIGTPVRRAAGFTGVNSSVANRGVQLLFIDPEIKHETLGVGAPDGATYFKMDLRILNPERDFVGENGQMDLASVPAINGRKAINVFVMRRVYYDASDEVVGYDKKWNFAADTGTAGYGNTEYHAVAENSILSTALFYPGLDEDGEYRWGTGHGIEYMLPESGSHLMRFIPRSDEDYGAFVEAKYTNPIHKIAYSSGLGNIIDEISYAKRTIVVPVSDKYVYYIPTRENSAGVTSKYNLGLD